MLSCQTRGTTELLNLSLLPVIFVVPKLNKIDPAVERSRVARFAKLAQSNVLVDNLFI
jgi:hypothetical protein